jgi:hypothetical protein
MSFTNLQKKNPEESNLENEVAREWSSFLSIDQETPCPERNEHDGRSGIGVVHHVTGKLPLQGHDAKQYSPN